MTDETLDIIHQAYQEALSSSTNLLEIVENLYEILQEQEVSEEDADNFDSFIDGVRGCLRNRQKTFEMTNLTTYINITLMYIVQWLNETKNMHIDVSWYARRKALESDLTKVLRKSNSNLSVNIRDRFGLRGIILKNGSEEECIEKIYKIYDIIAGILAGKSRKMKSEFVQWIESDKKINPLDKVIVEKILDIPFGIDYIKDYIKDPKQNGYRSLQFTMMSQMYSEVLPGALIEIQLRTEEMHIDAEQGKSAHWLYKKENQEGTTEEEKEKISKVFTVDDFSKISIPGFTGYGSKEEDRDGIHFSKDFSDRRISTTLVPE